MSPINFELLQAEYPELATAWAAMRPWFARHGQNRYVEWSVLLRSLKQVPKRDLVFAIQAMIDEGMLRTAYRFKSPGGYLLEGEYEAPDQMFGPVPDRDYSGYLDKDECDIVSGYRWEPAGAS